MLPFVLPLFADAAPAPPLAAETTRLSLGASAVVAPMSSTYGASQANSNSRGARASGNGDVTLYLREPLVDDDSPLSIQPFLQRTSVLSLDAGGQYLGSNYSAAANGGSYTQGYAPVSASTRAFVTDSIALLGGVGVDYLHDRRAPAVGIGSTRDIWEPWGSIGVDARHGDAGLSLQWQFVDVDQTVGGQRTWRSVFWPRLSLAGRLVLDRRYDVTASATIIPDGVEGRVGFAAYPTKELGLSVFVQVDHGQIFWDSGTHYDRVYGGPAVSYWFSPRTALSLSYSPTWTNWAQGTTWEHPIMLGITARLP
jgi:hypothetical protein